VDVGKAGEVVEVIVNDTDRGRRAIRCAAVLFDMDGTLVDSSSCVESTWRMWAAKHGVDIDALLSISHGRQNHETIRLIAPHLETPEEIAFLVQTEEDCHEGIREVCGARALLDSMGAAAPWAVVTSAWRTLAEKRLRLAGLPIPGVLITSDDISHSKPHPEGYLLAAARLGVAPTDCVVIEDAHAGIEAGRAAGMTVIGITTTFPRIQLGCEWCIGDFRELTVSPLSFRNS
jgi:mannitol-1-/sugar-/sorbitol-6-phosphatase